MSEKPEMPIEYHVGAADLDTPWVLNVARPGDTLVIACHALITQEEAGNVKARAEASLPEGAKVLVVVGAAITIARGDIPRDGTIEGAQS